MVEAPPGSYAAVNAAGRHLLAAELSQRLGRLGAAVARLPAEGSPRSAHRAWGTWFAAGARGALAAAGGPVDAIGYAGAGGLALLADEELDELLSPTAGEVVANNRFSADAFVVAGDLPAALAALERCESDNAAPRALEEVGFRLRDLGARGYARFDVDTPQDLALLRLAGRLPGTRPIDRSLRAFLEMARLPGGGELAIPRLDELGAVLRDRRGELVVAGRIPSSTWQHLERETACRVRLLVEERGMRAAAQAPRSLLAHWLERHGAAELVEQLTGLGDAIVLDSRVLMAALARSSAAGAWPAAEERYASDFGDSAPIRTAWLRQLTEAAVAARVPVLLGGHALVSDGLRILVDLAWQGR